MHELIRWTVAVMVLIGASLCCADDTLTMIKVTTAEGQAVQILDEDLTGLISRPLVKTRKALDKKFRKGFFSLYRIQTKVGTELVGEYSVTDVPCRLTIYEISKPAGGGRELRVVATGYHVKPEKAVFRKKIEKLEENVFLITAEKVTSPGELNSHLRYLENQDNTILLKGYSTNWNLTKLKLKMAGKNTGHGQKEVELERDFHWLVDQLINPLWLMSIRIEAR